MQTLQNIIWQAAVVGRWTARILGSLALLFFLALVFGEGPPNPFALSARENLTFLCMALLFLGLGVAWLREGLGGALTLAAFAALGLVGGNHLRMPALQIPATLGGLHLVCWLRLRMAPPSLASPISIPQRLLLAGSTAMALFLLLCANEIFGNPPLMTPTLRPGPALIGTWSSDDLRPIFTIRPDGAVTGTVEGTIRGNRSWFGKLMRWRTEYIIQGSAQGSASAHSFLEPLALQSGELRMGRVHLRRIQ
ncbi:MAG TPA: hypothetical protein VG456_06180 [Candidatus Sulfopaludibacter sp.]|jgi:hypothetical protein|nr:hypothetical protein [Candidatus Sulfopaludibacter sp.]